MARLTCCVCGNDLGDAEDPYRDPDCMECLDKWERECEEELERRASSPTEADALDECDATWSESNFAEPQHLGGE